MDKVNAIFNTLVTPRNNSGRSKIVSKRKKSGVSAEAQIYLPTSTSLSVFDKMMEHQKTIGSNRSHVLLCRNFTFSISVS